mmetsp:Transcript_118359/g.334457  ORF Transcript_118359/g.334457 Transcript_118359/m.334457 type:complete len:270 (+) Transcript_118359:688-1497(+)
MRLSQFGCKTAEKGRRVSVHAREGVQHVDHVPRGELVQSSERQRGKVSEKRRVVRSHLREGVCHEREFLRCGVWHFPKELSGAQLEKLRRRAVEAGIAVAKQGEVLGVETPQTPRADCTRDVVEQSIVANTHASKGVQNQGDVPWRLPPEMVIQFRADGGPKPLVTDAVLGGLHCDSTDAVPEAFRSWRCRGYWPWQRGGRRCPSRTHCGRRAQKFSGRRTQLGLLWNAQAATHASGCNGAAAKQATPCLSERQRRTMGEDGSNVKARA